MKLSELLILITKIAEQNGVSTPFVCGGVVRDRVLGRVNDLTDVDLTTGDSSIHILGEALSTTLRSPAVNYIVMPDQHARMTIGNFKLDFSSNFVVPQITRILKQMGVVNSTSMQQEVFSRDFTCNALLMSLDLKNILDPTGSGVKDIQNKHLRTCLSPAITLGLDNKRVIRILYLAAKLGFTIDDDILKWVKLHPAAINNVKPQYLAKKLQKALDYNSEITLNLLDQLDLWSHVPPLPALVPYMSKKVTRI